MGVYRVFSGGEGTGKFCYHKICWHFSNLQQRKNWEIPSLEGPSNNISDQVISQFLFFIAFLSNNFSEKIAKIFLNGAFCEKFGSFAPKILHPNHQIWGDQNQYYGPNIVPPTFPLNPSMGGGGENRKKRFFHGAEGTVKNF